MKKIVFVVLILVLLTACGSGPAPIVPTPNPLAPKDDAFVTTSCAVIYPSLPDTLKLSGFAVLDDYKATSHLFLKNLENGRETELATPNDTVADIRVSPDHKSVAYELGNPKTNEWSLIIADAQGQRKAQAVWKNGFFVLGNWVNSDQVLIQSFPPFVVYNPMSKEEKNFEFKDFPGYLEDARSNRTIEFDRSLERAVYKNSNDKVSLYDMSNKKMLAEVDNHPAPTIIAAWAPDGSQVAVVGTIMPTTQASDNSDDLFGMMRDGQVKQLTHLTDHYGKLVNIYKTGLSWSPDGRFVAFWGIYIQNQYKQWELMVVDTTTQKTTNYCIANTYDSGLNAVHQLPVPAWSADGKQLLVENRYDATSNRVLVLDLASKNAYQIEENKYPAGWIMP